MRSPHISISVVRMFLADMGPSSNTNQAPRASGEPSVESSSMPSSIGDSVTCDEQVLSRRERFRHRALILGEETLSAEVKIFAKVDLPSLRALAEAAGSVDETKRQVFEHLKVEVVAAGFSCPTPRELLEIREIFSEVASYPHPMLTITHILSFPHKPRSLRRVFANLAKLQLLLAAGRFFY